MSQFAQLSEEEIEERFHITGLRPVQFLLSGFVRSAEPFTVQFAGGKESFLTLLLAVLTETNELVFDCSGSQEQNRHLLDSTHNIFVARPEGIHVQFACGPAREVLFHGNKAFALKAPPFVVRLQRREAFRIELPRSRPVRFQGRTPDGISLDLIAHDLSIGGIGLISPNSPPESLVWGTKLSGCRILLPEEERPLTLDVSIRQLTPITIRQATQWRLGLQFENLSGGDETRLQRHIAKVELERRELG
jgi:c-di-GMP-binding flagellar brake protein YcgR